MSRDRVVYSTEQGRICPGCGKPVNQCTCRKQTSPLGDGNVRMVLTEEHKCIGDEFLKLSEKCHQHINAQSEEKWLVS